MQNNTAVDAGNVCQSCGLCCSGALFSYVAVDRQEVDKCKSLGFEIEVQKRNKHVFKIPCTRLSNNRCSVYNSRPRKCIGYHCSLAKNVIKGATTYDDAIESVQKAHEYIKWLTENAKVENEEGRKKLNIRDHLSHVLKKFTTPEQIKLINKEEKHYINEAFEYLKLIDNEFRTTSLLTKYSMLIQSINYA